MREIRTGISPEYVKGWDVEKAIREIVQNWLDSRMEFKCEGTITWEDGLAKVKDSGPGLAIKHLAMGISEKSSEAIGKYGEGLKLALLVMAREKREISIWSNGQIISPVIEFDEDYQTETMKLMLKPMLPRHAAKFTGTSIKFRCTKEELEKGKQYFMAFQTKETSGIEWWEQGKISKPGGRIYVNGAAVGALPDSIFSYHISGEQGSRIGNRDRTTISEQDLNPIVKKMLSATRSFRVMKEIMRMVAQQDNSWESRLGISPYDVPSRVKKVWKKAINTVFGKEIILGGDHEENTQAAYRGYRIFTTGYCWRETLSYLGMRTAGSLHSMAKASTKIVKISDLTEGERKTLKQAIKLVETHYAKVEALSIAESLQEMAGTAKGTNPEGLWSPSRKRIYIRRTVLQSMHETVHVVLHETVHKETGTSDCTAEFEHALLEVAIGMMKLTE